MSADTTAEGCYTCSLLGSEDTPGHKHSFDDLTRAEQLERLVRPRRSRAMWAMVAAAKAGSREAVDDGGPKPKSLGAVVRDHRVAAGLTLRELATRSYLSTVDLGRIERGVWVPPAGVIAAVFVAIDSVGVGS